MNDDVTILSQWYYTKVLWVGWVCLWSPPFHWVFFLQVLWYLSLHKRPTLQILSRPWTVIDESALRGTTAKTLFIQPFPNLIFSIACFETSKLWMRRFGKGDKERKAADRFSSSVWREGQYASWYRVIDRTSRLPSSSWRVRKRWRCETPVSKCHLFSSFLAWGRDELKSRP